MGVMALREPVRPWQLAAIGFVVVAVVVDTVAYGKVPWFALLLAISGGLYGLFKKKASAGALESLALETTVVAPFALVFLIVDAATGIRRSSRSAQGTRCCSSVADLSP